MTRHRWTRIQLLLLSSLFLWRPLVSAVSLGIPLDNFLNQLALWVVGLGLLMGLIGLAGWAHAHLSSPHSQLLSGSLNFFTTAGLMGGGTTLLGLMGLTTGAMLPL